MRKLLTLVAATLLAPVRKATAVDAGSNDPSGSSKSSATANARC
ncbi:MAG: hypothetical protein ACRDNB_10765 [Gaiellaceae bacterium]